MKKRANSKFKTGDEARAWIKAADEGQVLAMYADKTVERALRLIERDLGKDACESCRRQVQEAQRRDWQHGMDEYTREYVNRAIYG